MRAVCLLRESGTLCLPTHLRPTHALLRLLLLLQHQFIGLAAAFGIGGTLSRHVRVVLVHHGTCLETKLLDVDRSRSAGLRCRRLRCLLSAVIEASGGMGGLQGGKHAVFLGGAFFLCCILALRCALVL